MMPERVWATDELRKWYSCNMQVGDTPYIREDIYDAAIGISVGAAFDEAGHTVPKYSWLVYFPHPGMSDKSWFYLDHNDPAGHNLYWFPSAPETWRACRLDFNEDEQEILRGQIYESLSLDQVPAKLCLDVLPECVRKVVEAA